MNKLIVMSRQVQWRVGRMHEHTCIPYKETRTSVGSIDLEYSNTTLVVRHIIPPSELYRMNVDYENEIEYREFA